MKSLPFHILEPWERYPFRPGEAFPYRPLKGVPRGRLDFLKVFFRFLLARWSSGKRTFPSSETQGQIKGARESLNGRTNIYGMKKSKERREDLFSSFFTSLRATFFRPFRLSLVPTICPWVSEDGTFLTCSQHFRPTSFLVRGVTRVSVYSVINKRLLTYHQVSNQTLVEVMHSQAIVSDNIICFTSSLHARWTEGKKEVRLRVVPFFPCG